MQAQNISRHPLGRLLCTAAVGLLLASCHQSGGGDSGAGTVKQTSIVGGPGEKTFAEKYSLSVTLPMPETAFLEILKRLKLQYDVYGERGSAREIPPPSQSTLVDPSKMQKVYQIYGEVDRVKRTGEMYWAYVDMDHRVVYIENRFSYTGP